MQLFHNPIPNAKPREFPFHKLLIYFFQNFFSDNELRNKMVDQLQPDLFRVIRERTDVNQSMKVEEGHLLVIAGCMAHSCGNNNAITIVDMMNDKFHSIYQVDNKFYSIGDNLTDENTHMVDSTYTVFQEIYNKYLREYDLQIDTSKNGEFQIKNINAH